MEDKKWKDSLRSTAGRHSSRKGAFSAGLTALAVAAVILFNLLVAQLPDSWTQFDMSGSGIYDITETSRTYLAELEDDVVIHVLANRDSMDSRITRFLDKYEDLSDHLSLEYIDPTVYPSVLSQYDVESGTVVVTCEATGLQESFDIDDIIGYDELSYYYYGTYTETDFDAEGLLTSAVDGVLTTSTRAVYETTGHNENAMSLGIEARFKKLHMSVDTVNLLTNGGIPEDCSLLVIQEPEYDLADDELTMILDYLAEGGQVIYSMASQMDSMPNFETLCATYGLTVADGFIADTSRYYQNNPYWFFPVLNTTVDAAGSVTSDSTILFLVSRGMTLTDPVRDTITTKAFLSTSENGYAVTNENNTVQGTYAVGAVATEAIDDDTTARLTVYGAGSLLSSDILSSFPNVGNADLFMSSVSAGFEDVAAISIAPVSLSTPTNVITTGGIWALLFIIVIPAALLICGFVRWMRRRKL